MACIKCLGKHPCPGCDVLMKDIWKMGRPPVGEDVVPNIRQDNSMVQARIEGMRKLVFQGKASIGSKRVEKELDFASLIPARVRKYYYKVKLLIIYCQFQSPFSIKLAKFGFDFYSIFVPDVMHEYDLGLWKAVFQHLVLILYDVGNNAIQDMNRRYLEAPPFGQNLRAITKNPSSMKQLAAHHYEDLLQVRIF